VSARWTLAVIAAAFAALPASAPAAPPLEIGVQDEGAFVGLPGIGPNPRHTHYAFGVAHKLHARVEKLLVIWKWVARRGPGGETFDWSHYDGVVAAARAHGLEPQLTLTAPAPAWDTGDGRAGVYRPDPAAFRRFAEAAAAHYAGTVRRWTIWNEPNWPSWLAPTREAARIYRRLYRAGWTGIKAVDPHAEVLFGELAPMGRPEAAIPPLRFLRAATCRNRALEPTRRCGTLFTDGFAHHPYTLRWPPAFPGPGPDDVTMGSLPRLRHVLRVLARRHALETPRGRAPDLYLTEYGFHANSRRIREPFRSRYAVEGYRMAAAHPHVREIVWYQLVGPRRSTEPHWDTGLVDSNGHPRPTLRALARWIRKAIRAGLVAAR